MKCVPRTPTTNGLYEVRAGAPYVGRWPDRDLAGKQALDMPINPDEPVEPPEDGCPGAWYRTAFVGSLVPYVRDQHGRNWRYEHPATPWQVRDAIDYFEAERIRCDVHQHNAVSDNVQRKREREARTAAAQPRVATLRGRR